MKRGNLCHYGVNGLQPDTLFFYPDVLILGETEKLPKNQFSFRILHFRRRIVFQY